MAFDAGKVVTKFVSDTSDYESGRQEVERGAKTTSGAIAGGFFKAELALKAVTGAIELMGKGLKEVGNIIMAGAEYERLKITVGQIADNMGYSTKQLDSWRKSLMESNTTGSNAEKVIKSLMQSGLIPYIDEVERGKKGTDEYAKGFEAFALVAKDFGASMGYSSGEAIDMLTTAIAKNRPEMLESLGINLNMRKVYNEFADSIGKTRAEMTAEEESRALLIATMKEGKKVYGTYDAVYDTAAKNIFSIKNAMKSTKEYLGEAFQPAFKVVTKALLDFIKAGREIITWVAPLISEFFTKVGEKIGPIIEKISNFTQGVLKLAAGIGFAIQTGDAFNDIIGEAGKTLGIPKKTMRGFMEQLQKLIDELMPLVTEAFNEFKLALGELGGVFKPTEKEAENAKKGFLSFIIDAIKFGIKALIGFIKIATKVVKVVTKIAEWVKKNQDIIKTILTVTAVVMGLIVAIKIVIAIVGVVAAVISALASPITLIIALIALLVVAWKRNWGGIQEKVRAVVDWIKNTAWPILQQIFKAIGKVVMWLVQNIIIPFVKMFIARLKLLAKIVSWLWTNIISPVIKFIAKIIGWLIQNIIVPFVKQFIANIKLLAKIFKWLYDNIISPVVKLIWAIIARVFTTIWNFLKGVFTKIVNDVKRAWGFVKQYIIEPLKKAWEFAKKKTEGIRTWIKDKFNKIVEFLKGLKDKIIDAIVAPFKEAKGQVEEWANDIKGAADKINPFHKESPSLVENVQKGVDDIINAYRKLSSLSLPSVSGANLAFAGGMSAGGQMPVTQSTTTPVVGNKEVHNHINIKDYYGDMMGVRSLAERIKKEQQRLDTAEGK